MATQCKLSINHPDNPKNPLYDELQWIANKRVRALSLKERRRTLELESRLEVARAEIARLGGDPNVVDDDKARCTNLATPITPPPAGEDDAEWDAWCKKNEAEENAAVEDHFSYIFEAKSF